MNIKDMLEDAINLETLGIYVFYYRDETKHSGVYSEVAELCCNLPKLRCLRILHMEVSTYSASLSSNYGLHSIAINSDATFNTQCQRAIQ